MRDLKIFDAHLHIIDRRFPLVRNNGYLPDTFSCEDYRHRIKCYEIAGGAVVSGSFQAFDQTYLIDALQQLGPSFVGVTQLPGSVSDDEVKALHAAGIRAVRFNITRGGSAELHQLDSMAHRFYELAGWHVELYIDSTKLSEIATRLVNLPSVSIDHLGLSKDGFARLLALAERGVRVKASGFGRVDFDIGDALRDLYSANPDALMFGTDLPSTRAPRPYQDKDIDLIAEAVGEEGLNKVLYGNAASFYRMDKITGLRSGG